MIVLSFDRDSELLKVLLAARLAGREDIPSELDVSPTDKRVEGRRVPVLLVNNLVLEGGNTAVLHLLPPPAALGTACQEWLDWEHRELGPQLIEYRRGGGSDKLKSLLSRVDSSVKGTYLLGDDISCADVCVAGALFPLLSHHDDQDTASLLSSFPSLTSWYSAVSALPAFKECEKTVEAGLNSLPKSRTCESAEAATESTQETLRRWETGVCEGLASPASPPTPLVPQAGRRNLLITSALPYVNNIPHLGNIIGCVLSADIFARFCRQRGVNTLFVCGTDEYGTATETKALEEGLTPRQICDKYHQLHRDVYSWFHISFDHFGRTTSHHQTEVVQQMFKDCHSNGFTLPQTVDQLLCEKCDRFLADRLVEGTCPQCKYEDARGDQCDSCGQLINAVDLVAPRCKVCSAAPVLRQSRQLFLDLPKMEGELRAWVEGACEGWTHNARVITKAWLREGLKPRCITRDLKWGIPVPLPGYESKVFYVWFDAPIGYMSLTRELCGGDWERWWAPSPEAPVTLYQFMAKDNVPFHSIMFPATLLSSGKPYLRVSHLIATEYLNYEDGKFSKSRGVGVFGNDAADTGIPADIYRFYLAYVRPESQDSAFSWADLAAKVNTDLLNNLGNFVNRALMFSLKFFDGEVPRVTLGPSERDLVVAVSRELAGYLQELEGCRLREALRHILNISRLGNQYIQSNQPWVRVKGTPQDREAAGSVTGLGCQVAALLAALLEPYMPATAATLAAQLNLPNSRLLHIPDSFLPVLPPGHRIAKVEPLFTKIEAATVEALKKKYAGRQAPTAPGGGTVEEQLTQQQLEEAVAAQGEKVRAMKQGGSDKAAIQDQVALLLDLKTKLCLARGDPPPAQTNKSSSRKKKK